MEEGMEGSTVLLAGISAQSMQVMNLWGWWCPGFLFWLLFLFAEFLFFFLPHVTLDSSLVSHRTKQQVSGEEIN